MNPFLIIAPIITAACLVTMLLFLIIKLIDTLLDLRAPCIGIRLVVIPEIAKILQVSEENQVYDLGSSD